MPLVPNTTTQGDANNGYAYDLPSQITVSATDTSCRLDVRDTGCGLGLPPEDWDRVFERAYTTRSHARGEEPGGAGLHYAREKLAAFEGLIAVVESRPNEGTMFAVILQRGED